MVSEFSELINSIRRYYGDNFVGLIVYELPKQDFIGILAIFKERSPIMIDDSIRLMNLAKHLYPDAKSVAVITLSEFKEKLMNPDDKINEFLRNIVFVHDETGELKKLLNR